MVTKRAWDPVGSDDDASSKPDPVGAFECLVCRRVSERMKMSSKGFSSALPHVADETHYGCPFPKGHRFLGKKSKKGNAWQEEYAQAFVKSILLEEKFTKGKSKEIKEENVNSLLGDVEIAKLLKYIVASEGEEGVMSKGEDIVKKRIKHLKLV